MNKGFISTIQRYSTKDGPGIRSTVFFKGCNLRCKWCANPELIERKAQLIHFENRCRHCGACVKSAINHSIRLTDNGVVIDREACTNIDTVVASCPWDAYEKVGYEINAEELVEILLRDKAFYDSSGGGVTFSGGEPALQGEFVAGAASLLREEGVHTALDTAGCLPWEKLVPVVNQVDMVLYDIKAYEQELHRDCTGVDNAVILDNAARVSALNKDMIVCMVIVPGLNDGWEDVKARIDFIKTLGGAVSRVDILGYHALGEGKYRRLGMECPTAGVAPCNSGCLEQIKQYAIERGLAAYTNL